MEVWNVERDVVELEEQHRCQADTGADAAAAGAPVAGGNAWTGAGANFWVVVMVVEDEAGCIPAFGVGNNSCLVLVVVLYKIGVFLHLALLILRELVHCILLTSSRCSILFL
jgi:hypothetical protein